MDKFRVNQDNFTTGFQMDFDNGVTVSVQFGKLNASDGGKTTAEVAVWNNDNWFVMDKMNQLIPVESSSDVMPRCTPEEVAEIINQASKL
jgi:hypothetical protein